MNLHKIVNKEEMEADQRQTTQNKTVQVVSEKEILP